MSNSGLSLGSSSSNWTAPAPSNYSPAPSPTYTAQQPAATPSNSFSTSPSPSSSGTYDAYINLGNGPYANAGTLTTGNGQAWYLSPAVDKLFGGVPNAQQQSAFDSTVLQRVQQTFTQSGVPVTLTDNPNDSAAHTLSVVSGTTNPSLSNAIGMTYLGGNGFHFIDNSASSAQTVDQLEWIVAHNISHELMLAFGVPENYDQTGNYVDARNASWSMMTNPNATFSPAAVNALLAANFQNSGGAILNAGAQLLGPETVPEPTTVALWVSLVGVGIIVRKRRSQGVV
jgi:hypothetical protein